MSCPSVWKVRTMIDFGMPLDLDLRVKLVSIFTTSGGSCAPWGLIITLLYSHTSLHIFIKHIELKAMSRPVGLGTLVAWDLLPHRRSGINQYVYVGDITELPSLLLSQFAHKSGHVP